MAEAENGGAPIDFERLREVAADDTELINELLEMYFSQTAELLTDSEQAIAAQDADAVYKAAHKALGSSLTCGMDAIVPSLKELEQIGRNGDFANADRALAQAQSSFAELQTYLESNRENIAN